MERQTLDMMGMLQPGQDTWRGVVVMARWLRLYNTMRFGTAGSARNTSWAALTDSLLHHSAASQWVPLIEAKAKVWLSTVDSSHHVMHVMRACDVVILDEAGSAPEWKMPLLTRFQPQLLLMVGDQLQLPPFTSCDGFRPVSVLERMALQFATSAQPVKMLTTQYRMHPHIADFVSRHFYKARLQTAGVRKRQVAAAATQPLAPPPIVWRAHCGPESTEEHGFSTLNHSEARIICNQVVPVLAADPGNAGKTIVIITLYKGQLRLLEQMLAEQGLDKRVAVMTADSAQGSEADVVVVSLVRSNTASKLGHAIDRRRINVAVSRARDRLVVVGDADCFRRGSSNAWVGLWKRAHKVAELVW